MIMLIRSIILFSFLFLPSFSYSQVIQSSDVLQNGFSIFSCYAGDDAEDSVVILDLGPAGVLHDDPANHGAIDQSPNFTKPNSYTRSDFEGNEVMATSFDRFNGEIYVATSVMYGDGNPGALESFAPVPSIIYNISADGSTVNKVATLPGNLGTGWMEIDPVNKILYVSNIDDGLLYSINLANGFNQTGPFETFAPHAADPIDAQFPAIGERVLGVGYNELENKVYYAVWAEDDPTATRNSIRSISVDSSGVFDAATDINEFDLPDVPAGTARRLSGNTPVADIEFNSLHNTMLVAQQSYRSLASSTRNVAHNSTVLEFQGSTGSWVAEPYDKHQIGRLNSGAPSDNNARGGVDFAYHDIAGNQVNGFEDYIIATGDALPFGTFSEPAIYGAQFHLASGGGFDDSIKIDFNGDVSFSFDDKYLYGDIDVRAVLMVRIGDTVWFDSNADGLQNEVGTGIAGVTVNLYDQFGNLVATTVTDANGNYFFDVPAGEDFVVRLDNPADYLSGGPLEVFDLTQTDAGGDDSLDSDAALAADGFPEISLVAPDTGEDLTLDFGFTDLASLGDFVWEDTNANGVQDPGEPGINGVTIMLFDALGNMVTTDALGNPLNLITGPSPVDGSDGFYMLLNLLPGDYTVKFTPPPGSILTTQGAGGDPTLDSNADPATGITPSITLDPGENDPTIDAGIIPLASLGDFVWEDTNANGVQDPGEPGINGVTIMLFDALGNMVTTDALGNPLNLVTGPNPVDGSAGFYMFSNLLPGDYTVKFTPSPGSTLTTQEAGGDPTLDSNADPVTGITPTITLVGGQNDPTIDAGVIPPPDLASLGTFVFMDANANGIQDPGETGINGVTIMLFDAAGNMITTDALGNPLNLLTGPSPVDGSDGFYMLSNLLPGDYTVKFTPPPGFTLTTPGVGGDPTLDSNADSVTGITSTITLVGGQNDPTIDVGVVSPTVVDVVINVFDQAGVILSSVPGWVLPSEATELNLQAPPFNLSENQYGMVEVVRTTEPSLSALAGTCFAEPKDNPMVVPWNGFLEQFNILTVQNTCPTTEEVELNLFDADGIQRSSEVMKFAGNSQLDVSLNALEGYEVDQLGTVTVSYQNSGCISGNLSRFKLDASGSGEYDFDLNLPLVNMSTGTTFASYNTFQPSLNPADAGNPVYNWLEVINLSDTELGFTKNIYNVGGDLVETEEVSIPSQARRDLQAGHENPGASNVGIVELIPSDAEAKYFARVMRYGSNPNVSEGFDFSTSSDSTSGQPGCKYASVSSGGGAENWLVISNLSDSEASVNVQMAINGVSAESFPAVISIPAKGQAHISASNSLTGGASGVATVCSLSEAPLSVESNFYFRDAEAGNVSSAYTRRSDKGVCGESAVASYNTFLGQDNWLRLTGVGAGEIVGEVVRIESESGLSSSSALE